jgi:hypothetical protein
MRRTGGKSGTARPRGLIRNHYNPKYERCFMFVRMAGNGLEDWELRDAFEGTALPVINTATGPDYPSKACFLGTC